MVLSAAMSLDGYLDNTSPERLLLSNDADFDRVDSERALSDAILVGATTIRADNPRLQVQSDDRRGERAAAGKPRTPLRVTVTSSADLDPASAFFADIGVPPIVYCPLSSVDTLVARLGPIATVVAAGEEDVDFREVLDDLSNRGVGRLLVEGGGVVHSRFLADDLADELQLVIAPILVGEPGAPRFLSEGQYPAGRLPLAEVRQIGDVVLLRFELRTGQR